MTPEVASGSSRWRLSLRRSASCKAEGGSSEAESCAQLAELLRADDAGLVEGLVATGEIEGGAEAQLHTTIARFVRAEKGDVEAAHKRLQRHVEWRRQTLSSGFVSEDGIRHHLDGGKALLVPAGAKGRPVLVALARNHVPDSDIQTLERFIIYCLEAASRYCWNEGNPDAKLLILCDLSGLAFKNLDAAALRSSFALLNGHYPERAAGIVMYRAPAIFSGLWKVVSPFIDPVTRAKVRFVDEASALAVLEEVMGLDAVPREYGGHAEALPIQEAVRRLKERAAAPDLQAVGLRTCRLCAGECVCGEAPLECTVTVAA